MRLVFHPYKASDAPADMHKSVPLLYEKPMDEAVRRNASDNGCLGSKPRASIDPKTKRADRPIPSFFIDFWRINREKNEPFNSDPRELVLVLGFRHRDPYVDRRLRSSPI